MRNFILAANWKMHKTPDDTTAFFREFNPKLEAKLGKGPNGGEKRVVFFVPALDLSAAIVSTRETKIEIGGQNIHAELKGAFTGENSAAVLKTMGAKWALVGHSERRSLFGETDLETASKMKTAIQAGLSAMLCVGETLQERESGKTLQVVSRQLEAGLAQVLETLAKEPSRLAIAYEPVWAIGTGKVASPEQASEVHVAIRQWLSERVSTASEIAILYGGSVKPENSQALGAMPEIDGFLVGGASLEAASFLNLF